MMSTNARIYTGLVIATGLAVVALALTNWDSANELRFGAYLLLALAGASLKLRLPGMTGTMSLGFVFILVSIAEFKFPEAVVVGSLTAFVQSVWRTKRPPKLIQVLFNMATLVISTGAAYWAAHFILGAAHMTSLLVVLPFAGSLFLVVNMGLVATVLSLTEGKPFIAVLRQSYLWVFPYFAVGGAIAGLVCASSRTMGWELSMLVLPVAYLLYLYYGLHLEHAAPEETQLQA